MKSPPPSPPGLERALVSLLPSSPLFPPSFRIDAGLPGAQHRRARLLYLLGRRLGAPPTLLLRAAAAVEAVHLAALIHDDVLDDAAVRRGRATLHRTGKRETALLLGDILFSRAVASIHRLGRPRLTERFLKAVEDTCAGEILETSCRNRPPWTDALYRRIIGLKTAALFRFCGEAAGILAGRRDWTEWGRMGMEIGRAYQIIDDCLDLAPPAVSLDKDRLSDLKNAVPSLPLILGLADTRTADRLRPAIGSARRRRREEAGKALRRGGHLRRAAERAGEYLARARAILTATEAGKRLAAYLDELDSQAAAIREWKA